MEKSNFIPLKSMVTFIENIPEPKDLVIIHTNMYNETYKREIFNRETQESVYEDINKYEALEYVSGLVSELDSRILEAIELAKQEPNDQALGNKLRKLFS